MVPPQSIYSVHRANKLEIYSLNKYKKEEKKKKLTSYIMLDHQVASGNAVAKCSVKKMSLGSVE